MPKDLDRRSLLSAGLASTGFAAGLAATAAAAAGPRKEEARASRLSDAFMPQDGKDQTAAFQRAIDEAAARGTELTLGPGRFLTGPIVLRPNTRLSGMGQRTIIEFAGGPSFLTASDAPGIRMTDLVLDGTQLGMDAAQTTALLSASGCERIALERLEIRRGLLNGVTLARCSGTIGDCTVRTMSQAGIMALDSEGLEIIHNAISDCANNGIQIWRSEEGEDGTLVSANRIERIAAKSGGTGQNGNGVNVFRAGSVLVTGNRIADCAYTAIRGNAADNIQMVANSCARLGEVALYAEFGFEGALIANNLVDRAASGVAVTNFNEGGRLAVVQGNLIRNLFRREHEPVDTRGIGIGIEADCAVTGNVVEAAATAGISVGWGPYLRDVAITGNLIRNAGIGILVSSDAGAGACLVANNMISGTKDGAIRAMDHGTPHGPDLASAEAGAMENRRLVVSGNLAV